MLRIIFGVMIISILTSVGIFAQDSKTNKDEEAVRQIVKELETGWNAGSGKQFAAPFAENADYVVVNGMFIKGREAIDKGHQQIFDTFYKGSRNAATVKQIRFLRPDVAVVHVEWNLKYKKGGEDTSHRAYNTLVLTRENGKWQITAFHNTEIADAGR